MTKMFINFKKLRHENNVGTTITGTVPLVKLFGEKKKQKLIIMYSNLI